MGKFADLWKLSERQHADRAVIDDAQVTILQGQGILWRLLGRENHEDHVVVPDFLKACTGETDVAQRRVSDKYVIVINITQHDKMLKAGVGNRHDRRVLQLLK